MTEHLDTMATLKRLTLLEEPVVPDSKLYININFSIRTINTHRLEPVHWLLQS